MIDWVVEGRWVAGIELVGKYQFCLPTVFDRVPLRGQLPLWEQMLKCQGSLSGLSLKTFSHDFIDC